MNKDCKKENLCELCEDCIYSLSRLDVNIIASTVKKVNSCRSELTKSVEKIEEVLQKIKKRLTITNKTDQQKLSLKIINIKNGNCHE